MPAAASAARAPLERVGERELPVALHGLAHLGERLARDGLDVVELARRARGSRSTASRRARS